jgi:hypothetical protein
MLQKKPEQSAKVATTFALPFSATLYLNHIERSLTYEPSPPACYCQHSCNWWKVHGPHPEGYREPKYGPNQVKYDPAKHDRFICED